MLKRVRMRIPGSRTLRVIGWVAAYVLALNTVLVSFALPSASAIGGAAQMLCLTGNDAADGAGTGHTAEHHCPACTAAPSALPPPAPPIAGAERIAHDHTVAARIAERQHAATTHRPGQPRAPPVLA